MKRFNLYIFTFLFCLGITTGCNDEEFLQPENPPEQPWPTVADFDRVVIAAYYAMGGNGGWRHLPSHRRLANIAASDVPVFLDATGNADMQSIYERDGELIAVLNNGGFRAAYNVIGAANAGIGFITENGGQPYPNDVNRGQLNRMWGELLFLRGFSYWSLAKMYNPPYEPGGDNSGKFLPKRLSLPTNIVEAQNSELFSTEELYMQIISDLELAFEKLPERFIEGVHFQTYSSGRVNKFAAAAILSRLYMEIGDDQKAMEMLNYVIDNNGGDYTLDEDPLEAFNKLNNTRGNEVLWYYRAGDGGGWKEPGRLSEYTKCDRGCSDGGTGDRNSGGRALALSDHALEKFGWMDPNDFSVTQDALNDKRYTQLTFRYAATGDEDDVSPPEPRFTFERPYVWNNKYYRAVGDGGATNVPLIRLAEMYLSRALLHFKAGDLQKAADDLNVVRSRAWDADAAGMEYMPIEAADVTADVIHTERMKEMFFEGDRLWYLQSQKVDIPNGDRGEGSIPYNDPGLYYNLPDAEIDRNQGIIVG